MPTPVLRALRMWASALRALWIRLPVLRALRI